MTTYCADSTENQNAVLSINIDGGWRVRGHDAGCGPQHSHPNRASVRPCPCSTWHRQAPRNGQVQRVAPSPPENDIQKAIEAVGEIASIRRLMAEV